jgi:PAS domain S-box-containing protein
MPVSDKAASAVLREKLGDAVLGAVSDAIVYADREGVVRYWNPGAERLFGFAAAEALGRSVDLIFPEP